jgi:photosystem II stability/assembly factor-like uncharacterized protein
VRRWIAALVLLVVGGSIVLATGCGGGSTTAGSGTPVPPGWNKHASSEGLTLTVDPPSGQVWSTVLMRGRVPTQLAHVGDKVAVQFWPEGSFRTLGKGEESKYKGDIWPATGVLTGYIGPDGTFETDPMKIPRAIKVGDEVRLVVPGHYWFALVLDDQHAVFAPFDVTPEQPLPTVSPAPYLSLGAFQFLDSQTGWLSASSCRDQPRPTPDDYGNEPTQPPPICKAGFYDTTDGGQTWSLLSHEGVGPFVMDGSGVGLAAGGFCQYSPCNNSVLRTTDGGRHWAEAYSSAFWLTDLTFIDGEAWLLADSCGYSDGGSCERDLLKSTDSGSTWSQTTLPITGLGISISRPTRQDAWITSMNAGPGTAEIIVTHDGGETWTSLPHPAPRAASEAAISFRTAEEGWLLIGGQPGAGSQAKELFGTTDGGRTWTHLSGGPAEMSPGYAGSPVFTSAEDGWMALAHVALIHSTDGGKTWTPALSASDDRGDPQSAVQFTDTQHGWTVLNYYQDFQARQALWSTSDGGATWQQVPLPTPESP